MRAAIVGLGSVGETCAHALVASDTVRRLVLLNRTVDLADMVARDLRQARAWGRRLETDVGSTSDGHLLQGCDLVVLTLGPRLRGGQDRRAVAREAVEIYEGSGLPGALQPLEHEKTCVLVVTNPVDLMVTWLADKTHIPPARLFGLGTTVESARCSDHLARGLDVDAVSAWVHVLGEHGEAIVLPDRGRLEGLVDPAELGRRLDQAKRRTLQDAALIRGTSEDMGHKKAREFCERLRSQRIAPEPAIVWVERELSIALAPPATRFSIAACVVEVARSLSADSDRVLTLSALPPTTLGLPEVALSLPYAVRRGGLGRCLLHQADAELREVAAKLYAAYLAANP